MVNEDTLLHMIASMLRNLGNIHGCGHKMFLFLVSRTPILRATGKRLCPQHCVPVCHDLNAVILDSRAILRMCAGGKNEGSGVENVMPSNRCIA